MPDSGAAVAAAAAEGRALFGRGQQRPQSGETVRGRDAERDQLGERFLDLRAQETGALDDLVVERCAVMPQVLDHPLRPRAHVHRGGGGRGRDAMPRGGGTSRQQRDRRGADGTGMTGRGGGRRRQARPDRAPGQAQVVEPRHVVAFETRRQHLRFPGSDRRLEALQLTDHRVERVRPFAAVVVQKVLPAEQKPHEILRADGLDLLPQPLHRVPMDPREQRAIAPFARARRRECAGHGNTLRRERRQRRVDVAQPARPARLRSIRS